MLSLFDQVLEASGGPKIISEQHDTGRINWARGLSDPGEMIACGYMPEARRLDGESDVDYQRRLEAMDLPSILGPERMARLIEAAVRRAGLDTSTGKVSMMSAGGIVPWHGLGVVVDRNVTGLQAMKLATLDWTVEVVDAWYKFNQEYRKSRSARSVIRNDNGFELGSVGTKYTAFQNSDLFEFGDAILGLNGAHWETAGAIYGGSRVWGLMKFDCAIEPIPGDITEPYGLLTCTHDGSGKIRFLPTAVRTECANTTRIALLRGHGKGFGVKHTKNVKTRMRDAARALGFAKESFEKYGEAAESLTRKPIEVKHYANDVLDAVLDITQADIAKGPILDTVLHVTQAERDLAAKSFERKVARRSEVLMDIIERYEGERCRPKGTAWAGFNAVTESIDHGKLGGRYRGTSWERQERRFENVLIGAGDDNKQTALELALNS